MKVNQLKTLWTDIFQIVASLYLAVKVIIRNCLKLFRMIQAFKSCKAAESSIDVFNFICWNWLQTLYKGPADDNAGPPLAMLVHL